VRLQESPPAVLPLQDVTSMPCDVECTRKRCAQALLLLSKLNNERVVFLREISLEFALQNFKFRFSSDRYEVDWREKDSIKSGSYGEAFVKLCCLVDCEEGESEEKAPFTQESCSARMCLDFFRGLA
jgi:hypothetical protein